MSPQNMLRLYSNLLVLLENLVFCWCSGYHVCFTKLCTQKVRGSLEKRTQLAQYAIRSAKSYSISSQSSEMARCQYR